MKQQFLPLIIIISLIIGCGFAKININDKLINFESIVLGEMEEIINLPEGDEEKINSPNLMISQQDTILYKEGEICVSILMIVNSCTPYTGDIEFKSDTILLKIVPTKGVACSSKSIHRMRYFIRNPNNQKYHIFKE